jgi:hypothetical protein
MERYNPTYEPLIDLELLGFIEEYQARLAQPLDDGENEEDREVRAGHYLRRTVHDSGRFGPEQIAIAMMMSFASDEELYSRPGPTDEPKDA